MDAPALWQLEVSGLYGLSVLVVFLAGKELRSCKAGDGSSSVGNSQPLAQNGECRPKMAEMDISSAAPLWQSGSAV